MWVSTELMRAARNLKLQLRYGLEGPRPDRNRPLRGVVGNSCSLVRTVGSGAPGSVARRHPHDARLTLDQYECADVGRVGAMAHRRLGSVNR